MQHTRRHWGLRVLGGLLVLGLIVTSSSAIQAQTTATQVRSIRRALKQNHAQAIVIVNGRGQAPRIIQTTTGRNAATADRLFPIASLQKVMTGVSLAQLIRQNKLTLNDRLSRYYPHVRYAHQITVQQLITHSSGIRDRLPAPAAVLPTQNQQLAFTLRNLRSTGHHFWHYSNAEYGLLSGIISRVSKTPYQQYLTRNVLKRAGLSSTQFAFYNHVHRVTTVPVSTTGLNGFDQVANFNRLQRTMAGAPGAGELYCTPRGYWQFIQALTHNKLVPLKMITKRVAIEGGPWYFDGVYNHPGLIHADGANNGYDCTFYCDYRHHKTLMLFTTNMSFVHMETLGYKLFKIYFGYSYE